MMPCLAVDMPAMVAQLQRHEGMRLRPYVDTVGMLTIGVGRNLSDNGITVDEAHVMLEHDIATAIGSICQAFPWASRLDAIRQRVLIDLAFNMGISRLRGFTRMLAAVQRGDFARAGQELWASDWARQVQLDRSHRLVQMLTTGQEQP
jgi:lysozyme